MSDLAERAKEARESVPQFKTVPPFARAIGVKPAAVYQIENGSTKTLRAETLAAYERATGYRAEWIRTGKGERKGVGAGAESVSQPVRQSEETMAQALVLFQVLAAARPMDKVFRTITWQKIEVVAKAITEAESQAEAVPLILERLSAAE